MPFLKLNLTKAIRLSLRDVRNETQREALIRFISCRAPDILVDVDLKDILQTDEQANQPSTQPTTEGGTDA